MTLASERQSDENSGACPWWAEKGNKELWSDMPVKKMQGIVQWPAFISRLEDKRLLHLNNKSKIIVIKECRY